MALMLSILKAHASKTIGGIRASASLLQFRHFLVEVSAWGSETMVCGGPRINTYLCDDESCLEHAASS